MPRSAKQQQHITTSKPKTRLFVARVASGPRRSRGMKCPQTLPSLETKPAQQQQHALKHSLAQAMQGAAQPASSGTGASPHHRRKGGARGGWPRITSAAYGPTRTNTRAHKTAGAHLSSKEVRGTSSSSSGSSSSMHARSGGGGGGMVASPCSKCGSAFGAASLAWVLRR